MLTHQEVGAHERAFVFESGFACQDLCAVDLVLVDSHTDNLAVNEFGDFAGGPADATAHIEDFHAGFETHSVG